jgi:chemotaxis protein methyltransferase CheR
MQELTNRVTTNETYCYRTPRVWAHLREVLLPEFLSNPGARQMKLWSAAASTGEEAHTIAAIMEDVRLKTPGFNYSVLGTDISSRVIDIAEEGHYVGRRVARFKKEDPGLFASQMVGNDADGYRLNPEAKRRITFRLHNLLQRLKSGGPFDVVFLRNVLIYFTNEDQEKILANVHAEMRPEGTLIIGESETLGSLNCKFEPVAPLIYRATRTMQKGSA